MADISIIHEGNTDYHVKDAAGRLALAEVENKGAKNLFDIQHPSTVRSTSYNATADGGVELTCSNAAWTQYIITDIPVESGREYAFTLYVDEISGTNTFRAYIRDNDSTGNVLFDSNNISTVKTINATITSDSGKIWVGIYINNSATAKTASAKIRAMLCTKAEWDISNAFVPYGKTNADLTLLEKQDRAGLATAIDKGAKNLLKLGFTHKSAGTQTADMTADGNGIIVNGDRNTTTDTILVYDLVTNKSNMLDTRYTLPAGKYVIPSTGTANLRYQVYCHDGTNYQSLGYTMSNPLEFEYTSALKVQYPYIAYRLWASRVSSFDNLTVYPMICTKAEWDISQVYVPYCKTNTELTNNTSTLFTENTRQETEIGVVANAGAKNLLNPDDYIKNSTGGLTITETGTGTYKITGTPSGTVDVFTTQSGTFDRMYGLEAGKTYTVSGLPTGNGLLCRIDVSKNNSGSWDAQIISNLKLPQTFTVPSDATGLYIRYRVTTSATIPSGGISLEPMIRPAAITDPTFQPYAKTNRELTVLTDEDRAALVEIVDSGAKNLSRWNSGTSTSAEPTLAQQIPFTSDGGEYTISYNTALTTGKIYIGFKDSNGTATLTVEIGNANKVKTITIPANTAYFNVYAPTFGDYSNFMICTKAAWDISHQYEPYAKTNRELTVLTDEDRASLVELVDGGAKNLLENSAQSTGIATVNLDGSVTINGSQSTDFSLILSNTLVLDAGTYVMSTGTAMPTSTFLTITIKQGGTQYSISSSTDEGYVQFTLTEKTNIYRVYIWVAKNKTINDLTIKPMVCIKAAWDISQTFQPHRPSWQEMFERIVALETRNT